MGMGNGFIIIKVGLLIFDRSPKSLNKIIVNEAATTIHADPDMFFFPVAL